MSMPHLSLRLFGGFDVRVNGQPCAVLSAKKKPRALLAYLALHPGQPQPRDKLAALLWGESSDEFARVNLRQILYQIRKAVPEARPRDEGDDPVPLLIANRQEIRLNPAARVEVDVVRFETLLDQVREHQHEDKLRCPRCRQDLEGAVELYRGDFLLDFYLDDSDKFESWAQSRRESGRRKMLDALETLTRMHMEQKEYGQAQLYAERQLTIDNLREIAYRQLMEIMVLNGQRSEAIAAYEEYRRHPPTVSSIHFLP